LETTFLLVLDLLGSLGSFFAVAAERFCLVAVSAGGFPKETLQLLGSAAELLEAAAN
jgi:hypothetical protein